MKLTELPNIGPKLAKCLEAVDIRSPEELRAIGTEMAFLRIKAQDPTACLHKLTAIEGAVRGMKKSQRSPQRRAELKAFFQGLPTGRTPQ